MRKVGDLSCSKCQYTTDKQLNLKRHMVTHEPRQEEMCELCGKKIKKDSQKSHWRLVHTKLQCKKCDAELEGYNNLKTHMSRAHREICDDCGLPLQKEESFEDKNHKCPAARGAGVPSAEHMAVGKKVKTFRDFIRVMPDKSFLCFECGFCATSEHLMVRHDSTVHRNIVCSLCSQNCFGRSELVRHMRADHPQACVKCGGDKTEERHNCAKVLSVDDDNFNRHIPVKYRPLFCSVCFEHVSYGEQYRVHMKKEHGVVVEAMKSKPKGRQKVLLQTKTGRLS